MGAFHTHPFCEFLSPKKNQPCFQRITTGSLKLSLPFILLLAFIQIGFSSNAIEFEGGRIFLSDYNKSACDNVTNGGEVAANEFGCPNPTWNPSLITSISLPQGGSGTLEFIWIMTTDDPQSPGAFWNPIFGSNAPEYDPGPISETTYYRRCARRSGCTDYVGESNIIVKESICCDNITDGGVIAADQVLCDPPFAPNTLTNVMLPTGGNTQVIEYQWAMSTTGSPYTPSNPDWTLISGANTMNFDPGTLAETTYFVRLSRRHGCYDYDGVSNIVEIIVNTGITVELTGIDEICLGATNGEVSILNISGGALGYSFQWTGYNGETNDTLTNLAQGTYEVVVTDANGCTGSGSFTLNEGPTLTLITSTTDITCIGEIDGTASVDSIPNGISPFTYLWDDVSMQNTAIAIGLFPTTYQVIVSDERGCTGSASVIINDAVPIDLSTFSTDATCGEATDGTASVQVTGGVSPYAYLWSDSTGQTTATAFNLSMGTYNVTVTDNNGCTASNTAIVNAPMQAELSLSTVDASCAGSDDGSIAVAVMNGNINDYTVLWSNAQTSSQITGLLAGDYSVTVTDVNGCTAEASGTISEPTALLLLTMADSASCFGSSDGTAEVTVSGGTPFPNSVYQYTWSATGIPNVPMLDDVSAGIYTVTVTDANGCTAEANVEIGEPEEIQINLVTTNISCNGLNDGSALAEITGGNAPYTFQWNNPNNSTSAFIENLSPGAYGLSVTDANSCLATAILNIMEPALLNVNFNNVNVVCADDTDGVAVVVPNGGTVPYSILWETGQMTQGIFNVGVGSYGVTITDANGCEAAGAANIISTTTLNSSVSTFDATCFDVNNGVAVASGLNGTSPYSYLWSNGETTAQINDLFFGTYNVTITDGDGCSVTNIANVSSPPLLVGDIQIITQIQTYGGNEGSATVNISGGIQPYSFLWSNGSTSGTATGLEGGVQSVTVTDANGCTSISQVTFIEPSKIGDYVWDDINQNGVQDLNEVGIGGIKVILSGITNIGDTIDLNTITDTSGFYAFDGLIAGFYMVEFETLPSHVFTYQNIGNDAFDSDADPTTGKTQSFPITQGEYEKRWDCGMIVLDEKINIGDKVWYDTNHDGIQGQQEAGVEGIVVRLRKMPSNNIIAVDVTDILGNYLFPDVLPGDYKIEFALASFPAGGFILSPKDQGNDDTIDSDANITTGITDQFTVFPFTLDDLTRDAGIFKECDNITDGGVIGYNEDLCGVGADPSEIVNVFFPSGGYGVIEYLWLRSSIPVYNGANDPNWVIIPNSNSPNYDPGPLGQSTYYIRCARRQGCDDYIGESNVVAKKVTQYPLAQIIAQPNIMCKNQGGRFEAAIAGANATYYWEFGGGGSPATATTRVVDPVSWATPGSKTLSLTVTRFGCSFTVTTTVIIDDCTYNPLIAFDNIFAEIQGEAIRVEWHVKGNTNNTVFFVQSSEDGLIYRTIGNTMGQSGAESSSYSFIDNQPKFGKNHYRINYEKLDSNNESGYSPIAEILYQRSATELAQAFPNPTTGFVTVELLNPDDEIVIGEVVTPFGKTILTFEIPANTEKYTLDLSKEFDGLYLIKVKQSNLKAQICKVFKAN